MDILGYILGFIARDRHVKKKPDLPKNNRMFKDNIKLDSFINTALFEIGQGIKNVRRTMRTAGHYMRINFWWRQVFGLFSLLFLGAVGGFWLLAILSVPALEVAKKNLVNPPQVSAIFYDREGNEIGRRGAWRTDQVPLEEMPDYFIKAVLSTEDRRFFEHFGLDFIGLTRAMITNAQAQAVVQGGSTLTQQLAKNLYLSSERSLERKINEAFLSLWLEARFSKQEILRMYLDRTYMASGVVGVDAAAEYYFGKSIKEVSLAEAAILAGMFKAPTKYAPTISLPRARARANEVLTNLVQAGFMTEGQVFAARRNPARAIPRKDAGLSSADYFLDNAFEELLQVLPEGHEVVRVYTTLDPEYQRIADDVMQTTFREFSRQYRFDEGAMLAASKEGEIQAIIGGRDYSESQFNRATQALRQPGSAFKPFVYAEALSKGYKRTSRKTDRAIRIGNYVPRNYYGGSKGTVTLESALAISINTIPVALTHELGRQNVADRAYSLGINTQLQVQGNPSLPLGSSEVTVHDMVTAYNVFLNEGIKRKLYSINSIQTMEGQEIFSIKKKGTKTEQVLDKNVARELNMMLHSVIYRGTARRAKVEGVPTAGKTGTTTSYKDGWFVGFTGDMVAAFWFGNDSTKPTRRISGGNVPAISWQRYMARAHEGLTHWRDIPGVEFANGRSSASLQIAQNALSQQNENSSFINEAGANTDPQRLYQKFLSPEMKTTLNNLTSLLENEVVLSQNESLTLGHLDVE